MNTARGMSHPSDVARWKAQKRAGSRPPGARARTTAPSRRSAPNGQNHRFEQQAVGEAGDRRRRPRACTTSARPRAGGRQPAKKPTQAAPEHLERQPRSDPAGDQRGHEQRERAEHEPEAAAEHPAGRDQQEEHRLEAGHATAREAQRRTRTRPAPRAARRPWRRAPRRRARPRRSRAAAAAGATKSHGASAAVGRFSPCRAGSASSGQPKATSPSTERRPAAATTAPGGAWRRARVAVAGRGRSRRAPGAGELVEGGGHLGHGEPRLGREDLGDLRGEHRASAPRPRGPDRRPRPRRRPARSPGRRPRPRPRRRGWRARRRGPRRPALEDLDQPVLGRVVEAAGGLVEQHHRRLGRQDDGEREAEALALGQVAGMGPGVDVGHEAVERRPRSCPARGRRRGRRPCTRRRPSRGRAAARRPGARSRPSGRRPGRRSRCGSRPADERPAPAAAPAARRGATAASTCPAPLRPIRATHLAGPQLEVDVAQRVRPVRRRACSPSTRATTSPPAGPATSRGRSPRDHVTRRSRWAAGTSEASGSAGGGGPAGVADRQRQRRPPGQATELDDRRDDGRGRQDRRPGSPTTTGSPARRAARPGRRTARPARGGARPRSTVMPRSCTSRVSAASTSSAAAGSSAEVGSSSTSTRGAGGEHRPDGHPLLLAAGQRAERTVAQLVQAEQVEHVLDPAAHDVGRHAQVLHHVGELVLDRVGDEAGGRVLADDADDVGQLAGRHRPRCGDRRPTPGPEGASR